MCPSRTVTPAAEAGVLPNAQDPGHYVYLGKGQIPTMNAMRPLVIERVKNHDREGMNVLFGDLHVEWLDAEHAEAILKQARALKAMAATSAVDEK